MSEAELDAIMGWTPGMGMSRIYTRTCDAARLAAQAIEKLEQARGEQSISNRTARLGATAKKPNEVKSPAKGWCGQEDSNLHSG